MIRTLGIAGLAALCWLEGCKEAEKDYPSTDPRLQTRKYCNVPAAVNYNWGFPGMPDNSTCFYGADLFTGSYRYRDSIYRQDGILDSARSGTEYMLTISRVDSNKILLTGLCTQARSFSLTAPRIGFRATFDTTGRFGQVFCAPPDSVNGFLTRVLADTVSIKLQFNVVTDSLSVPHRGTAFRR